MEDPAREDTPAPSSPDAADTDVRDVHVGPGAADVRDESFSTNRVYEGSPKHVRAPRVIAGKIVQKAPTNGQAALDMSVAVSMRTPRRVGVDVDAGEFVVFDRTGNHVAGQTAVGGVYHGHVRSWEQLDHDMRNALQIHGLVDRRGRITVDPQKWDTTP